MEKNISSLIVGSFLLVIFGGSVLLMFPFATTSGSIAPIDALFTATSAVTVTGLSVVDTATYFTLFGQIVILLLIQIGGLGFMTFSTLGILIMGKSFSLKDKTIIENVFTAGSYRNIKDLLYRIVAMTFSIELMGAVLLYFQFTDLSGGKRVYAAIFHSISAFCNAGFSIFSNNFESYVSHWGINLTIMALIICGGIGFLVMNEVGLFLRRKICTFTRFSLHTKMVLISSSVLIIAGFFIIFVEELFNEKNPLSLNGKILSSLFHSVSARTAGLNTINLNQFSFATILVLMSLMFIGASPGSTGGGVKTSTASVIFSYFRSRFKGLDKTTIFYRNLPTRTIEKAFIVFILYFVLLDVFIILLATFESKFRVIDLMFETISAFGTVGLSRGITADLSAPSKLTLCVVMFIGRVGPLTLLMALSRKETRAVIKYPEENVMIG